MQLTCADRLAHSPPDFRKTWKCCCLKYGQPITLHMRLNAKLNLWFSTALILLLPSARSLGGTEIGYDNTGSRISTSPFYLAGKQFGDEIQLPRVALFGVSIAQFTVDYSLSAKPSGNETITLRIFANDGDFLPATTRRIPGTLLFASTTRLVAGSQMYTAFMAVPIKTDRITWSVTFAGIDAKEQAGLVLCGASSVGSSFTDFWVYDGHWALSSGSRSGGYFGAKVVMQTPELVPVVIQKDTAQAYQDTLAYQQTKTVKWAEGFEDLNYVMDHTHWDPITAGSTMGAPHFGPQKAFGGQNCAVIEFDGNEPALAETRLIFDDSFVVPSSLEYPRLRFWHWYDFPAGSAGGVEIRGADGTWQPISPSYTWTSGGVWSYPSIDLTPFAGQRVKLAFHFTGKAPFARTAWYIDEVSLITGAPVFNAREGFESGWGDWGIERGTWAVGVPLATNGPAAAFRGQKCAGTSLLGHYADIVDSRLVSPVFTVPGVAELPRLRFWHWYRLGWDDAINVELREVGGNWASQYSVVEAAMPPTGGGVWSCPFIDLSAYAGKAIQIGFHFNANKADAFAWDNDAGWYLDEVSLETGPNSLQGIESFETGLGNWAVDYGAWEVGVPQNPNGPAKAFSGQGCASTGLRSNPGDWVDSRLISPPLNVPEASASPQLRFSQWYDFGQGEQGIVEIKPANGNWRALSGVYSNSSGGVWSQPSIDLAPYAGMTVQVAFHFATSYSDPSNPVVRQAKAGWSIDNVRVETTSTTPSFLTGTEGFEAGQGDWSVDQGVWEVGIPSRMTNPGRAYRGSNCAGTGMNGKYPELADSRLLSPWFAVPAANDSPRLRFWQWFSFQAGDSGTVEVREHSGLWAPLAESLTGGGGNIWSRPLLDLAPYAGKTVQFAFHFKATDAVAGAEDTDFGWFIDELSVERGPQVEPGLPLQPVGFEHGLGDWSVDRGVWEAGDFTALANSWWGPTKAPGGNGGVGTVFAGDYTDGADSRLISPLFTVPLTEQNPRLRFWQWFRFGWQDTGYLEIRERGGSWQVISDPLTDSGGMIWSRPSVDLRSYAGKEVQLAFHFIAVPTIKPPSHSSTSDTDAGWYLDEVVVEIGPEIMPPIQGFEADFGDWSVDRGFWQVTTAPDSRGPGKPWNGRFCAAALLDNTLADRADSRMVSPHFVVPALESHPRWQFWQWYVFKSGDQGFIEIQEEGGPWLALASVYDGSNNGWSQLNCDLGPYAGKMVRLAFHILGGNTGSAQDLTSAWFIDDCAIVSGSQVLYNPEGFEAGFGDWQSAGRCWEIFALGNGNLSSGPFKGQKCAGVFCQGNYRGAVDSWLIGPAFQVPSAQETETSLRFAYQYGFGANGQATLELKEPGGPWRALLGPWTNTTKNVWLNGFADLTDYAGKTVQLAFHYQTPTGEKAQLFLDEVRIQTTLLSVPREITSVTNIVTEKQLLSFTATSSGKNLQFQLGPGAPTGAHIDPSMGIFTWKPTEEQGPGYQEIIVGLNDPNNTLNLVDYEIIKVQVLESNEPPALEIIEPISAKPGSPLSFSVAAHDPDLPPQTLTFSLDTGAPPDARVDSQTGVFAWDIPADQPNGTNAISVRVTDDGTPRLSTTTVITVIVGDGTVPPQDQLTAKLTAEGVLQLSLSGVTAGQEWDLQTSSDLIQWTTGKRLRADGEVLSYEDADTKTEPVRFYRLIKVN